MRVAPCPLFVLLVLGLSACTPRLRRESLSYPIEPLSRPVAIAISYGPEVPPLLRTLEKSLGPDSDTASVNTTGLPRPGERVIRIGITDRAAPLATNFFVAFPGFIGLAPVWYRYQWIYRVRTWIELQRAGEPPLVISQDMKFVVADSTLIQIFGTELGLVFYGLPIGAGIVTATSPPNKTRFTESLGPEAGWDWAHDAVALIHQTLRTDEAWSR